MQVVAHAERRADVLQVVLDDRAAVLGDQRVERVRRLEVRQVRPRAEDAQRAQLAAMLVRHEVVRIVGARALNRGSCRGSCRAAGGRRRRDRSRPAFCATRSRIAFMSSWVNGVRLPDGRRSVAFGSNSTRLRIERRQIRFDLVVAERPEDLRGDFDGRGRAFRRSTAGRTARNQVSPLASLRGEARDARPRSSRGSAPTSTGRAARRRFGPRAISRR